MACNTAKFMRGPFRFPIAFAILSGAVFFPQRSSFAAVAIDSVAPGPSGMSCSGCSSLSWNHTISGANTLLTVGIAIGVNNDNRTVIVNYNGITMTSVAKVHSNNQTAGFVQMFYL